MRVPIDDPSEFFRLSLTCAVDAPCGIYIQSPSLSLPPVYGMNANANTAPMATIIAMTAMIHCLFSFFFLLLPYFYLAEFVEGIYEVLKPVPNI